MIDTQVTNLPIESKETGKLEEAQAPEGNPVEMESEVVSENSAPEAIIVPEEPVIVAEADVIPDNPVLIAEAELLPDDTAPKVEMLSEETTVVEAVPEKTFPESEEEAEGKIAGAAIESESDTPEEAILKSTNDVSEEETTSEAPDDIPEESTSESADTIPEEFETEEQPISESDQAEGEMIELYDAAALASLTKLELLECLKKIVAEPHKYPRSGVDSLRNAYYKIRRDETEAKKKEFLEGGGEEQDFLAPVDETEAQMKSLLSEYREKRASIIAKEERQKEANLVVKQHLIERLKVLTERLDDFNRRYNEFRDIQRKWREIRQIPQEYSRELGRNYQLYNERFYDIIKINNQFRDYDFKKNLEMKTILCETVERLSKDSDVVSAFHQLQKLHQQWREIGPVSKEYRESIWDRFKAASIVINKRHQAHFDNMKRQEERNLTAKEVLCKEVEAIDYEALKTLRDWDRKISEVEILQKKWRSIGFASKKQNAKIFERFSAATSHFFQKKSEFYRSVKHEMDRNLELKKELIEKAESMKSRTDWKETTKAFIELQNEWKKIGPVSRKHSEATWKQFLSVCDYFFERKSKEASMQKSEEHVNLEAKRTLIEKIRTINQNLSDEEALAELRCYIAEWNTIGYVPFREKDKLHKAFRDSVDKQFDRMKINDRDRRIQQFRSNLTELTSGSRKDKLYDERDRLMRMYDRMKNELQTYENNIGFISSKGGNGLLKEIDRKIVRLREEMEVVVKKIEAIDENLD
jgi:hypothetical protein